MYSTILLIHSYWRWAVLFAALAVLVAALTGLAGKQPFAPLGRKTGILYVTALDMQLLIGLALYALSPIVHAAWADIGAAMKVQELRFFAIEHLVAMLLAVAFAHIGSVRAKRATEDRLKYRRLLVWQAASVLALLAGMPWWRPLFRPLAGL